MEAPKSERAILSRDLTEFLLELSIALHRHSMYPSGHPSLEPAVNAVVRCAAKLLQDRSSIAVGVSRRQLLVDDEATDPEQPVLRRLAESLHRHHIGALSVTRGISAIEVAEALRRLARDAERDGAMGTTPEGLASWPHLKLHPMTFDSLGIGEDGMPDRAEGAGVRKGDLWEELARAALLLGNDEQTGRELPSPSEIASAINRHPPERGYDQAVIRHLVEIAHELTTTSAENAAELHQRTMGLVSSLHKDTLRRLLHMDGNAERQRQFLRDATRGMAVDAVLRIVETAAEADQQTISHGLLRMLTKIAAHAERGSELARPLADAQFREQVVRLLADWKLEDPNPTAYGRTLERLAKSSTVDAANRQHTASNDLRVVQIGLESNSFAPLVENAIDNIIKSGQLNDVFELLVTPPEGSAAVAEAVLIRLTRPEAVKAMLSQDRVEMAGLDALLPRLPMESFGPLLDAMGSSPNRAVRRRLLDWLSQTPVDISTLVIERLNDERWYVQRNMLVLLERSGRTPDGFSALRWAKHKDSRVRIEAIRLALSLPHERDKGIRAALDDRDPRVVRLGLAAIQRQGPVEMVDRVVDWAVDAQASQEIRVLAVSTLSRLDHEAALDALLHLADGGRTFFGRHRLPPKTPVLVAALRAITGTWAGNPRSARVLAAAARSSDPELRQAVSSTPS